MKPKSSIRINIWQFVWLAALLSILLSFSSLRKNINSFVQKSYYGIVPERKVDTNIVLIKIGREDIENLGGWPLKRSYYALLLKELNKYNVRKTGIGIVFQTVQPGQEKYDKLFENQLLKSKNVILGATADEVIRKEDLSFTGKEIFKPSVGSDSGSYRYGHLNYYEDYGTGIQKAINAENKRIYAFACLVSDEYPEKNGIKLNFHTSWKNYKSLTLLEFFDLSMNAPESLEFLKGKIILIGTTDAAGTAFGSEFDSGMPGIALQAFAVDNLLNDSFIHSEYQNLSYLVLFLLIGFAFFFNETRIYIFVFAAVLFFIFSLELFYFYQIIFDYSPYYLGVLSLIIYEVYHKYFEKKRLLAETVREGKKLFEMLKEKENKLMQLMHELNLSQDSSHHSIIERITQLKKEISELKILHNTETAGISDKGEVKEFFGIVHKSKKMQEITEFITKIAKDNSPVFITGESGTGKELAALAVHQMSSRRNNLFIAVNCGALTESLLESELFGHVKGAFTGSSSEKKGRFETADRGTLFLDEIGEVSENFQVKLLRVLQTGQFEKVGSSKTIKVDVRIIAATNKNPEQLVKDKKLREDIYYRLNVIRINLPPLRERRDDIRILAEHFLARESKSLNFSKIALERLEDYEWRGNVRELESVVKRAAILAKSDEREIVTAADLPVEFSRGIKENLETIILNSLREKQFSHSSITETGKEIGHLGRTAVAENFRGIVFKLFFENGFSVEKAVKAIAETDNEEVLEKLRGKLNIYLTNISKDIKEFGSKDFNAVKNALSAKYKNLPHKYHIYQDEIIRHLIDKTEE